MTTETAPSAARQRALLLAQAFAFGFQVQQGTDPSEPKHFGLFWWSLSRPGLIDISVSEGEWATLAQVHDAIILAHAEELMEDG